MRGERDLQLAGRRLPGESIECFAYALGICGDELGVVVKDSDLIDASACSPEAARAASMSSRYWRQLEYEL